MSRLQVGGLALELETGNIVTLISFHGDGWDGLRNPVKDVWKIYSEQPVLMPDTGNMRNRFYAESKNLMPLGDKQTQDELAKELSKCKTNI